MYKRQTQYRVSDDPAQSCRYARSFILGKVYNCLLYTSHPKEQYQAFRRTTLKMRGELEQSQLGAELAAQEQVLCIVNRRKTAQELYNNPVSYTHLKHPELAFVRIDFSQLPCQISLRKDIQQFRS